MDLVETLNSAMERERIRALAIRAYRIYAQSIVIYPRPRVLVASLPKAGSHLLTSLLRRLPRMMFSGRHYTPDDFVLLSPPQRSDGLREWDWDALRRALTAVRHGQFLTAHWPERREVSGMLQELGYRVILMLRDPRDVVVSQTFYITRSRRHHLYRRYNEELATNDDRLMASIRGLPANEHGRGVGSIGQRLAGQMRWLEALNVHDCRFEALVGERGGGSGEAQQREVQAIAGHVGRPVSPQKASELGREIWSGGSSTFRKGQSGDWRNHFTEAHTSAFKEVAGSRLVDLGYERDLDW